MNNFDDYMNKKGFISTTTKNTIEYDNSKYNQHIIFINDDQEIVFSGCLNSFSYDELLLLVDKCKGIGWQPKNNV